LIYLIDKTLEREGNHRPAVSVEVPKGHFAKILSNPLKKYSPFLKSKNSIIFNSDCLEILNSIPENSIDMIFADPPYMLSNDGFTCQNGRMVNVNKGKWDKSNGFEEDTLFHNEWISACRRVLKPEGTIWISGTYHSIYQCGYLLQKNNFHFLNDIAWFKPNASPNLSCRFFTASHETLIWARKDKKAKHTFNYDEMKNGLFPEDKLKKENTQLRSVWSILTPRNGEKEFGKHPTQKPLDLLKRIVLASTNENDIILDPFCGSGTTGVACNCIKNRNFIGIEIDKKYCELAKKRIF
jgi:site-specific DNA-methyltransferase (adenine-specific)